MFLATIVVTLGVSVSPAAAYSPAFGDFNGVTANGDRTMSVWGWALSPDFPAAALGMRFKIAYSYYTLPNYRLANSYRSDVGNHYPGYGNI